MISSQDAGKLQDLVNQFLEQTTDVCQSIQFMLDVTGFIAWVTMQKVEN